MTRASGHLGGPPAPGRPARGPELPWLADLA